MSDGPNNLAGANREQHFRDVGVNAAFAVLRCDLASALAQRDALLADLAWSGSNPSATR
jgi:hypothetical protein